MTYVVCAEGVCVHLTQRAPTEQCGRVRRQGSLLGGRWQRVGDERLMRAGSRRLQAVCRLGRPS
jgi:hypothetical protein